MSRLLSASLNPKSALSKYTNGISGATAHCADKESISETQEIKSKYSHVTQN